ncbi:hypothetical protein Tco_1041863 [Tanacetum coccineum]|uniref:Uncharacterized protein n=1 Tax=Tanacetum coccineum TaxID=301880 RepID=A0ABQ5GIC6_9ASTR
MSTTAMHNTIMEAGGKDHAPMLVPGSYIQWKSRIKRYIATCLNHELIMYCIDHVPYEYQMVTIPEVPAAKTSPSQPTQRVMETYFIVNGHKKKTIDVEAKAVHIRLTRIINNIYFTMDACPNAKEMWKAIERLMHGENINKHDVETMETIRGVVE